MDPTRLRILRALRHMTDIGHSDITPAAVSGECGEEKGYAWQELARCRTDRLADRSAAFLCTWSITDAGRAWLATAEREAA